jgi:hypothetical protein
LNPEHLALLEVKSFFENGNEDVVARGYKAPEEKDDDECPEGTIVSFLHGSR